MTALLESTVASSPPLGHSLVPHYQRVTKQAVFVVCVATTLLDEDDDACAPEGRRRYHVRHPKSANEQEASCCLIN